MHQISTTTTKPADVSEARARQINTAVHQVIGEVGVGCHRDDILDAVWGVVGRMSRDEEAVAIQAIRAVIG